VRSSCGNLDRSDAIFLEFEILIQILTVGGLKRCLEVKCISEVMYRDERKRDVCAWRFEMGVISPIPVDVFTCKPELPLKTIFSSASLLLAINLYASRETITLSWLTSKRRMDGTKLRMA
jgi:hypothetical protein